VLVKGGSLPGETVDVFFDGRELVDIPGPRIDTPNVHGTGCTLSAAICARLALGQPLLEAVRGAKAYLVEGLRRSYTVGKGRGLVQHLHPLLGAGCHACTWPAGSRAGRKISRRASVDSGSAVARKPAVALPVRRAPVHRQRVGSAPRAKAAERAGRGWRWSRGRSRGGSARTRRAVSIAFSRVAALPPPRSPGGHAPGLRRAEPFRLRDRLASARRCHPRARWPSPCPPGRARARG
jgi:hypothetical protein